ncbi:UDP-glucose 6-dehydrogenase, partial [Candidatus Roizmanbacteria bacterium CG17_big_fil_post_rev_8_21_14_2_50_39_7]
KKIAIWGLSFKPNTDDIRFAPSVDIIRTLLEKGYTLSVYDQEGMNNIKKLFGDK